MSDIASTSSRSHQLKGSVACDRPHGLAGNEVSDGVAGDDGFIVRPARLNCLDTAASRAPIEVRSVATVGRFELGTCDTEEVPCVERVALGRLGIVDDFVTESAPNAVLQVHTPRPNHIEDAAKGIGQDGTGWMTVGRCRDV
jgi:hypothetical protein